LELPLWLAAIVQVPEVTPVTMLPATVQTPVVVDVNVTASPEVAVADAVVVPLTLSIAGANEIVPMLWAPAPTVNDCCVCEAAL